MIDIKKELMKSARNSIKLTFTEKNDFLESLLRKQNVCGATRLGGMPDVPDNFEWPYFEGADYLDEKIKKRPLAFIAQFNLEEISKYDIENLLPKTGVLSFFYELDTQKWGFDPKDKGCARVYWFEDKTALHPAEFPDELDNDFRLTVMNVKASSEKSYQSYEDFLLQRSKLIMNWDEFDEAAESLGINDDMCSKLLGWANPIQGNMTMPCELIKRGYYLGDGEDNITPQDRQEAEQWANRDWLLLFQLDSISDELCFGDCGMIYFYIHKDDLAAQNFDNVWLILQCF